MSHRCSDGTHDSPALGCYRDHECRCDGCTAASSAYHAGRKALIRNQVELARAKNALFVAVPVLDLPWYDEEPAR